MKLFSNRTSFIPEDNEEVVVDGQTGEQPVENTPHLWAEKNRFKNSYRLVQFKYKFVFNFQPAREYSFGVICYFK